jgi:hypothetical protein
MLLPLLLLLVLLPKRQLVLKLLVLCADCDLLLQHLR